jgi:sporulation protein YlmC with PRC-barrel domain
VAQVVLDPIDDKVTHLIVEPEHRQGLGRLVPVEWVEPRTDHVDLSCTRAEFNRLEIAEEVRFLQGIEGYMGYEPDELLLWPYFGGNATLPVVVDTLPMGEVAVQRGEEVHASDGRIGEVEGLVVDGGNHHVSHVVLKGGHLFGRKQVAIPIAAVKSVGEDGIRLSIGKHEVDDLPAVEFHRRGQ